MDHHLFLRFLAIILLLSPLYLSAQDQPSHKKNTNPFASDIYIPLEGRDEVKIVPLLDTLSADKEYLFLIRFSSKYRFSELFFDKGLATTTDSFLSIRPKTSLTEGIDTATLRIIGFSNNSRILLQHKFILLAQARAFPMVNPNRSTNITVNNIVLERNMNYDKKDFPEKCVFGYLDNGHYNKDNVITAITMSFINKSTSKNLYVKDDKPNDDMMHELHKAKKGTRVYIRLDVKNGKKTRSTWTSFILKD
jgi:hypothetical protein